MSPPEPAGMRLGMVGLGRMGANMAQRLAGGGHHVVVWDPAPAAVKTTLKALGASGTGAASLEDMATQLSSPRVIWLMVPAGPPVEETLAKLRPHLQRGDVVVDGGNSNWKDSMRRATELGARGIDMLDCGTSGGVWGLKEGYCLMVGGTDRAYGIAEPLLRTLAPPEGYAHVGPSGAGHYVKMVHNGIEYSMLQAYAEGFEVMHAGQFDLDLENLAHIWQRGSVVRSWLLALLELAFKADGADLAHIRGYVEDSGEGRWTLEEALDHNVPVPALALSLFMRYRSRQEDSYSAKVIAALRNQFGGHAVKQE